MVDRTTIALLRRWWLLLCWWLRRRRLPTAIERLILARASRLLLLERLIPDSRRLLTLLVRRCPLLVRGLLQLVRQRLSTTFLQQQLMRCSIHLLARHIQRLLHLPRCVPHEFGVAVLAQPLFHEYPTDETLRASDHLEVRLPVGGAPREAVGQALCADASVTLSGPGNVITPDGTIDAAAPCRVGIVTARPVGG